MWYIRVKLPNILKNFWLIIQNSCAFLKNPSFYHFIIHLLSRPYQALRSQTEITEIMDSYGHHIPFVIKLIQGSPWNHLTSYLHINSAKSEASPFPVRWLNIFNYKLQLCNWQGIIALLMAALIDSGCTLQVCKDSQCIKIIMIFYIGLLIPLWNSVHYCGKVGTLPIPIVVIVAIRLNYTNPMIYYSSARYKFLHYCT